MFLLTGRHFPFFSDLYLAYIKSSSNLVEKSRYPYALCNQHRKTLRPKSRVMWGSNFFDCGWMKYRSLTSKRNVLGCYLDSSVCFCQFLPSENNRKSSKVTCVLASIESKALFLTCYQQMLHNSLKEKDQNQHGACVDRPPYWIFLPFR